MPKIRSIITTLLLGAWALPSYADTAGAAGVIADITINSEHADDFTSRRGRLTLDEGKKQLGLYSWGGLVCNNKNLSDAEVAVLLDLVGDKRKLLQPIWTSGLGSTRCLVAYRVIARKYHKVLTSE